MTACCRIAPSRTTSSLIETGSCSPSSAEPRRWHSRVVWSLDTPRLGQSLEGARSGHQSGALLCRYRCSLLLAEIPKGVGRNSELKERLQLWESGQITALIGLIPGRCAEQQGRRSRGQTNSVGGEHVLQQLEAPLGKPCRVRSGGLRIVQRTAGGTGPQPSFHRARSWNSRHQCAEAARIVGGGGRYKLALSAMREQGRSNTGIASLPHVELSPVGAPGPTGERQEHLDAIVSFAGGGQRRRLFRKLDILTIKWRLAGFLLITQLMFLKKKDPTSKQFDDDEWVRSLTEAQEATTNVPEDSVMYGQQDVDPKKVRPIQMGEFLRKYVSRRLVAFSDGEIAALTSSIRQIGVGTPGGAGALAIFHQLLLMNG